MMVVNVVLLVLVFVTVATYIVESVVIARSEYRMNRELRERIERMKDDTRG